MNPTEFLLQDHDLPPFSRIDVASILPALTSKLDANLALIESLLSEVQHPDWQNLIRPLEQANDELERFWSPISQLNSVQNTDELREVYNQCLPKLSVYATALGQNKSLCDAYAAIKASPAFAGLSIAQQKYLNDSLRDFHLSGVDLPEAKKKRYAEISQRLSELGSKFSENVLDATHGWIKHITDAADLVGVPDFALALLQQNAENRGLAGYVITLDYPCYLPVMQYGQNRVLREELYRAYTTRASDQGPTAGQWDNGPLMAEIVALRHEKATLLGFQDYAELSLASKMADSPAQVLEFLGELAEKSLPVARADYAELVAFAHSECGLEALAPWDILFASEKLRLHKYAVSQEELRPYFPLEKVLDGMFAVASRLFDLRIEPQTNFETYHPDVRFYHIYRGASLIARFYLDVYARDKKRGGAWMADCRVRRLNSSGELQLPVAFLTCNFMPPTAELPCLLTHDDVTTLFHEFGHGLHHMLTQVDVAGVSGINGVEWDAVELPSQFMENFCWEASVIPMISAHYQTGESLPKALLEKLLAAKNFQSGMFMVRQLEFALFDLRLHCELEHPTTEDIQILLNAVREAVAVYKLPAYNRFQHSFTHIFGGGYAAGYYSYKWAEVLSADAFAMFEENGLFDPDTGRRFLEEILERGGSEPAMELFKNFRGREPRVDALLRHSGIAA